MVKPCDSPVCFDCKCPQCMKPFPENSNWELSEASKLYKGKLFVSRKCDTCGEVMLRAWVDETETEDAWNQLRKRAFEAHEAQ